MAAVVCTRTVSIATFGCKVNQYEGQAIREELQRRGLVPSEGLQPGADAYIVNTCTVTERAFREGLRLARRLVRENPDALIAVTGCAADSNGEDFRRIGGVAIFGNSAKPGIASYLAQALDQRNPPARSDSLAVRAPGSGGGSAGIFSLGVSGFQARTRAYLKVQDGCDLNCSFCIIPAVRGSNRSRPEVEALAEARLLARAGYREIVLTGVHLGSFGKDRGAPGLAMLMRGMLDLPGLARVRLSSIEANEVTNDLIELMGAEPWRVCPHLHIPAQSGSDRVLRAMRRRYNAAGFLRTLDRVRAKVPNPSFTTDIIVGFPGETDKEFEETIAFSTRAGFSRVHVFPYSPRRGTDAAGLPDLPWSLKQSRAKRLEEEASRWAQDYCRTLVGTESQVVVEDAGPAASGYTERYVRAEIPASLPAGAVVRVRGVHARGATLVCG